MSEEDMHPNSDLLNERINIRGEIEAIKAILSEREKAVNEARRTAEKSLDKAFDSAEKMSNFHNDLIRKQERSQETYATKTEVESIRNFQAKLAGGVLVLAFIGITNLLRLSGVF